MLNRKKRDTFEAGTWWNPTGDRREYFNNRLRGWSLFLAAVAVVVGIVVHEVRAFGYASGNTTENNSTWQKPRWR